MLRTPTTIAAILAVTSGALYAAAFPPLDVGALGWVALVPLLVAIGERRPGPSALLGWLAGTVASTVLTGPSVYAVAVRADRTPGAALAAAVAIPQLYGAVWFALFAWLVARTRALRDARAVLLVPAAWVACELGRSHAGHACPWALLAHTQTATPLWLQTADLAGAAGPSFVLATVSAAVALLARRAPGRAWAAVAALVVVAAAGAYGATALRREATPADAAPVRVALVQAAVPDPWRRSLAQLPETLRRHRALTADAMAASPDLVVWPENAVGIAPDVNAAAFLADLPRAPDALVVGAPRTVQRADGGVTLRNSAWLLGPDGRVRAVYDKMRLAPFGEASPWTLLGPLAAWAGVADEYSPGDAWTLFPVAGHEVAPLVCFEAIYADVARRFVADGAAWFVNVSNDGWFGGHAGAVQHFRAALLRTVETRRWMVRATNAGITAAIDPRGVVVATLPPDVAGVLQARVVPRVDRTWYVRLGDWLGWTCVGVMLLAMAGPTTERRGWGHLVKVAFVVVVGAGLVGMLIPVAQMLRAMIRGG